MKKVVCYILIIAVMLCTCACGSTSYGVRPVQVLVEQDYSLAFRTGDDTYNYVTAAISELAYEGKVSELSKKWFGNDSVSFRKRADALAGLGVSYIPERTFIIGVDINSFPVSYISAGGYWGFDIELATAVCDRLNWTLQIQPIEKENVYIELSAGNIDCAWGGIVLDENEVAAGKYVQFGPYLHNDIVVAARNGSSIWNKMKLNGRNMAMSSTPEAMAALQSNAKLVRRLGQITRLAGGTIECFEYLYSGKCDCVLTDSTALDYYNCHT